MGGMASVPLDFVVTHGYNVTVTEKTGAPSLNRSIRLSEEAWTWLAEQAEAQRRSVNWMVGELVEAARTPRFINQWGHPLSPPPTPPEQPPRPRAAKTLPGPGRSETGQQPRKAGPVVGAQVPTFTRPAFNPQPKKGKK